jgi:hypothetical protein
MDEMKTLKANDLRIGNYITSGVNGIFRDDLMFIGKVLEIGNEEREFEQIYCECEESFEWFFKGNYFGIPLTEKWLLKFGFEWSILHQAHYLNGFDFVIDICEHYSRVIKYRRNGEVITRIEYVHQLQNLYIAITGEELTIK